MKWVFLLLVAAVIARAEEVDETEETPPSTTYLFTRYITKFLITKVAHTVTPSCLLGEIEGLTVCAAARTARNHHTEVNTQIHTTAVLSPLQLTSQIIGNPVLESSGFIEPSDTLAAGTPTDTFADTLTDTFAGTPTDTFTDTLADTFAGTPTDTFTDTLADTLTGTPTDTSSMYYTTSTYETGYDSTMATPALTTTPAINVTPGTSETMQYTTSATPVTEATPTKSNYEDDEEDSKEEYERDDFPDKEFVSSCDHSNERDPGESKEERDAENEMNRPGRGLLGNVGLVTHVTRTYTTTTTTSTVTLSVTESVPFTDTCIPTDYATIGACEVDDGSGDGNVRFADAARMYTELGLDFDRVDYMPFTTLAY